MGLKECFNISKGRMDLRNNQPLVSIVVTTYNRKELLTETIHSILAQSLNNFELIIVDNYSNYNFFDYIYSFNDNRIQAYQNQNNGIIAVNRNYGIKKAKGEYVAFCDDDDTWHVKKLETQLAIAHKYNTCVLISTLAQKIGTHCEFGERNYGIANLRLALVKNLSRYSNPIVFSSALVKKQALIDAGGFDEDPEKFAVEDYVIWIKIASSGKFILIKEILTYYRFQESNTSKNSTNQIRYNRKYISTINPLPFKILNLKCKGKIMLLITNIIHSVIILYFNSKRNNRISSNTNSISINIYKLSIPS